MDCKSLTYKLLSENAIPLIGFGTFQIKGKQLIRDVLDLALQAGYRSIDTAYVYHNEEDIGEALKELLPKHNLKREDIFITSKLPPSHHGDLSFLALQQSLKKLDCGYLDLYLIHWPGQQAQAPNHPSNISVRQSTWRNLIQARNKGLVRDIGVSNFTIRHLEDLLAFSPNDKPSVNQVEWHPHYHQSALHEFCIKEGILLQAYSSLGGSHNNDLISDSAVTSIAKRLNKQPAQVLLRWALQQNIGIIPKARSRDHIFANIDLNFDISSDDMNSLNQRKQIKYAWNPDIVL
ncbi:PREDICTED: glyoxal reductase-like [Nicrophorus vespilloides]|uniref:Glyoxal reductase-like n=1 Tax=Nicrophorus vespilloides TaxID=110193 RepID=A0ABM1ME58_NICVS|nr:PREDICTED: glyoxal reductase-like [Nicrophorus vespilloides]XP_017772859.1 PREDICTED: glyoxal reductase-like [Nicrophorus vespilloides]